MHPEQGLFESLTPSIKQNESFSRHVVKKRLHWGLNQRLVSWIFHTWGSPHIDLFATRLNRKLQVFVSPVLDPEAFAVNQLVKIYVGMCISSVSSDSNVSQEN